MVTQVPVEVLLYVILLLSLKPQASCFRQIHIHEYLSARRRLIMQYHWAAA